MTTTLVLDQPASDAGAIPQAIAASGARAGASSVAPESRAYSAEGGPYRGPSRIELEAERIRRYPAPRTGVSRMGIFSRTRDIVAANLNDLLDKAEDPAKMIRMMVLEMEETLVEVRASAARTIADQKEMQRHIVKLEKFQADWAEKAELAMSKDREDLARAALAECHKAADMAQELRQQILVLDDSLRAFEADIEKLQDRLREARGRQRTIVARMESAENRVRLRTLLSSDRVDEAMARFDHLERRVAYAEGRAEALTLADRRQPSLVEEIEALAANDRVEEELAALRARVAKPAEPKGE